MAGLWQQLCSPWQIQALFLIHLLCLLPSNSGALHSETKTSSCPLEGFTVVKGSYSQTFLRVGYHKIAEIPAGACNLSIQETRKSRNYLALQSKSGISIINGNWVIDRPGTYIALGTQLIYRRPNEIRSRNGESITVQGPLAEDVHLYLIYQQPSPSVNYRYNVPLKTHPTANPEAPSDILLLAEAVGPSQLDVRVDGDDVSNNHIIKETSLTKQASSDPSVHSDPQSSYIWARIGHTECSTTCGTGKYHALWKCVDRESKMTVPADLCDPATGPTNRQEDCHKQPCPVYWDVGEWSACTRRCGPGTQQRQVICRQVTRVDLDGTETSALVAADQCHRSERPVTKATCQLKICSQWEIRSEWGPCSVPCGVGQRSREVVCLSNQGDVDDDEECNMNLKPDDLQNCDMGACARSWFASLWSQRCSAECGRGNRTRSAVCLADHATDLPLDGCEGKRPSEVTSCDSGPCQNKLEWYTGPWGQCSAECGNGTQTRSLACILTHHGRKEVVDQLRCSGLSEPATAQLCRLKPCGVQWYVTEWSVCSRSCDGGYRVREVRCLADNITPSDRCDPSSVPASQEECNKQPCGVEINPSCSDQYHNCMVVVQARLCIYPYYRGVCCASCTRAQKTNPSPFKTNHIRR
ncbi:unnamed protein product [Menidia menidia]|uniref:(Atlantic silverside) hypothetical protein n=1 Tax=Menidia menidia TaxID=238744 RepID=A0A8S4BG75_9TELE|nr:unnamed protein product [Menidia menidia]